MLTLPEVNSWFDAREAEKARLGGEDPCFFVLDRTKVLASSSATLVLAEDGTPSGYDTLVLRGRLVELLPGSRRHRGLELAMQYARTLRTDDRFALFHTIYYAHEFDENTPWRNKDQCYESLADAASLFLRPRFALGFTFTARSRMMGAIEWRCSGHTGWQTAAFSQQLVQNCWLTDGALACSTPTTTRAVVVVESESMFDQLEQDDFAARYHVILTTGLGQPDMALRACLHRMTSTLGLRVYGFFDWNVWGACIATTYRFGATTTGVEAELYTFPLEWIGLQSADVDAWQIPTVPQTEQDRKRLAELLVLNHPGIARDPSWCAELREMDRRGTKCEFEAVCRGVPPGEASPVGTLKLQNLGLFIAQKLRAAGAIV